MNREIKFKYWITGKSKNPNFNNPRWTNDNDFIFNKYYGNWDKRFTNPEEIIPCQFTGLHDKNGNEIYEGDILKVYRENILQIKWSQESAAFNFADKSGFCLGHTGFTLTNIRPDFFEIIGNIFEKPELLNAN